MLSQAGVSTPFPLKNQKEKNTLSVVVSGIFAVVILTGALTLLSFFVALTKKRRPG